jgi:hypothetical protein
VQGRLREEKLTVEITTECHHCDQPIHLTLDSNLTCRTEEEGALPLIFRPAVDWETFSDSNIIDGF